MIDNGHNLAICSNFRLLNLHPEFDMHAEIEALRHNPLKFVCAWRGDTARYFPTHSHPTIELVYHPRGTGVTTMEGGRKIDFEPHGTVIYPASLGHDQRMHVIGYDICVHVALPVKSRLPISLLSQAMYIPPHREGKRADRYVRSEFLQLAQVRSDPMRSLELDLRVTSLVARLLQLNHSVAQEVSQSPTQTHLDRARQYIRDNYARITNVRQVAQEVGISEDYLRHIFAAHGGTSLNRLLNQTKIQRVKELLTHSRLSLKEISYLTGFETERYLVTRFKLLTGVSPGSYRRQAASSPEALAKIPGDPQ